MVVPKFTKRMLTDVQQTIWDVYCGGEEMDVAAEAVGLDRKTVYNKLDTRPELRERVEADLGLGYSPEQITGRLKKEFSGDPEMNVHHETIYRSVYLQARGSLKREVVSALRTGRTMRKPRRTAERVRAKFRT